MQTFYTLGKLLLTAENITTAQSTDIATLTDAHSEHWLLRCCQFAAKLLPNCCQIAANWLQCNTLAAKLLPTGRNATHRLPNCRLLAAMQHNSILIGLDLSAIYSALWVGSPYNAALRIESTPLFFCERVVDFFH